MELSPLIAASRATAGFKADLDAFSAGRRVERIELRRPQPPLKVLRVLAQLLDAEPSLEIDRVEVEGVSGCSDFVGRVTVHVNGEVRHYDFEWCCRWRAEQEGWTDYFGFPDQMRAAREFEWRCFRRWEAVRTPALVN